MRGMLCEVPECLPTTPWLKTDTIVTKTLCWNNKHFKYLMNSGTYNKLLCTIKMYVLEIYSSNKSIL